MVQARMHNDHVKCIVGIGEVFRILVSGAAGVNVQICDGHIGESGFGNRATIQFATANNKNAIRH